MTREAAVYLTVTPAGSENGLRMATKVAAVGVDAVHSHICITGVILMTHAVNLVSNKLVFKKCTPGDSAVV